MVGFGDSLIVFLRSIDHNNIQRAVGHSKLGVWLANNSPVLKPRFAIHPGKGVGAISVRGSLVLQTRVAIHPGKAVGADYGDTQVEDGGRHGGGVVGQGQGSHQHHPVASSCGQEHQVK